MTPGQEHDLRIAKSLLDHANRGWENAGTIIARGWIADVLGVPNQKTNVILNSSATLFMKDYKIMDCTTVDEVLGAMASWIEV